MFLRACVYASNMVGLSLALLGLHVMVHLPRLSSMCAPFGEFWSLYLGCRFLVSSLNRARLSTYDVELHVLWVCRNGDLGSSFSSHLSSGSRKIINRYGLRVPPYIVIKIICIWGGGGGANVAYGSPRISMSTPTSYYCRTSGPQIVGSN